MIQQEYRNSIAETSGNVATTGFTVEANASVYAMLTQNVYNDPILAVIREYSTNACDACIAAGVPIKYDVHLPTVQEPVFYVRDYGTGLPPDDIIGLFSTLGASTKRESNAYNGTLGIGRMAGLAAADAFTIESYYNQTQYAYVVSMRDGIPVTLHLGNNPTTEPNGLKLSISVQNEDIGYYKEKAEKLYRYFDHKPNLNIPNLDIELDLSERISDTWFLQPATNSYDYDNHLIMSQVIYQIPRNSAIKTHDFRRLVLKAPPGAVTFNPGRESLSLDKKTIEYLNKAFLQVKEDYAVAATTAMAACEDDQELLKVYGNTTKNIPSNIVHAIDPKKFMSAELASMASKSYGATYCLHQTDDFNLLTGNMLSLAYKAPYHKTSKALSSVNTLSWDAFFSTNHIIVDLKTNYKAGISKYYNNNGVLLWQRRQSEDLDLSVEMAKKVLKMFKIKYKLASEIVDPSAPNIVTTRKGLYANTINPLTHRVHASKQLSATQAKTGTYLYVKLKHTTPLIKDETRTFSDYLTLYRFLNEIESLPPIKGISKKYLGFVEDLDNWVDFETYIKTKVTETTICSTDQEFSTSMSRELTNDTILKYPEPLQQYFRTIKEYTEFRKQKNYVRDSYLKKLLQSLGASVIDFIPSHAPDISKLSMNYRLSFQTLFESPYQYSCFTADELLYLAKMEETRAICTSE